MSRLIFRFPLLDISKYAFTSPSTISSRLWHGTCSDKKILKFLRVSPTERKKRINIRTWLPSIQKNLESMNLVAVFRSAASHSNQHCFDFLLGFPRILRHLIRYKCNITQQQPVETALHSFKRKCVRLQFFIFFFIPSLYSSPAHSLFDRFAAFVYMQTTCAGVYNWVKQRLRTVCDVATFHRLCVEFQNHQNVYFLFLDSRHSIYI